MTEPATVGVVCLGCGATWRVPEWSESPGYDYALIACTCPTGAEPEFEFRP